MKDMSSAALAECQERARVRSLHSPELMGTAPEERFDRITRIARELAGTAPEERFDRITRIARELAIALDPQNLTFHYRCRGIPSMDHDPSDFPIRWTVSAGEPSGTRTVTATQEVLIGDAHFSIVPDEGLIDLFDTLDAVEQDLANIAEMLTEPQSARRHRLGTHASNRSLWSR